MASCRSDILRGIVYDDEFANFLDSIWTRALKPKRNIFSDYLYFNSRTDISSTSLAAAWKRKHHDVQFSCAPNTAYMRCWSISHSRSLARPPSPTVTVTVTSASRHTHYMEYVHRGGEESHRSLYLLVDAALCVCVCVQSSDRRANYILHPHLRRHQLTWWTTSPAPTILVEYVCWFVGLLTRRKKNERQRKKPFWTKVRRIYFGTKPIKVINTAVWC